MIKLQYGVLFESSIFYCSVLIVFLFGVLDKVDAQNKWEHLTLSIYLFSI